MNQMKKKTGIRKSVVIVTVVAIELLLKMGSTVMSFFKMKVLWSSVVYFLTLHGIFRGKTTHN